MSRICQSYNKESSKVLQVTETLCKDDAYIDCKLADDSHNICALRTLAAVQLCKEFCGYCTANGSILPPPTGTTLDTCVDSGDIDCKQMNDSVHICDKKSSPPTFLYCPKFCGLCTSSSVGNTKSPVSTNLYSDGSTPSSDCKDELYIDCKLADDKHNICVERTLTAVKYYQKYCGFCTANGSTLRPPPTGTSSDTCVDSGDIDCKQMNDSLQICAKKSSPPTLLYCPKFCGLCTSSSVGNTKSPVSTTLYSEGSTPSSDCKDELYIDCKLADDKHNICVERTLAAVKYCQKYCGYCTANGSTLRPATGTTIDTCVDSGDIDCKQMNDSLHICAKKSSPPTLLYCPKFCGLCTPSGAGNVAHTITVANYSTSSKTVTHLNTQTTPVKSTMITTRSTPATSTGYIYKTRPPVAITCAVCTGPKFLCEKLYTPTSCSPPNNYCINTITNNLDGTRIVDRTCGNFDTCYREWFQGSSDDDKCRNFDSNDQQYLDFRCTFCCIQDNCNNPLLPQKDSLYKPI